MKPIRVDPKENYILEIEFDNTEIRLFDVKPYITGSWFGELSDISYFKAVRIANGTVEWPDGQDIAPHELYELSIPKE